MVLKSHNIKQPFLNVVNMILLCLRFTAMIMITDATPMTVMAPTANSPPTVPSMVVKVYELEVYHNNKA